jgi:hypothetical protein
LTSDGRLGAVLVESGFVRVQVSDGREWSFRPALARIAALGTPTQIVDIFAGLHGDGAASLAAYVLATLCDQEDATDLIGGVEITRPAQPVAAPKRWWRPWARQREAQPDIGAFVDLRVDGLMPAAEQIVIAQHLMRHGIIGGATPAGKGRKQGQFSDRFDAAEFVGLARAHLGLSSEDAGALSMTELQQMLAMKFPDAVGEKAADVPSREEYETQMKAIMGARNG